MHRLLKTSIHMGLALLLLCPNAAAREAGPVSEGTGAPVAAFAADLHRALATEPGNLFYSPYSIFFALSMAREGAAGETLAALDRVLHVNGDMRGQLETMRLALAPPSLASAPASRKGRVPAYTLSVANRLWGQKGYAFKAPFLSALNDQFAAPLAEVDFATPGAARSAINQWIAAATQSRIRDLIPPDMPPAQTRLVLANAIYFKAAWKEPFYAGATQPGAFQGPDGPARQVPYLRSREQLRYGESGGLRWIALPYVAGMEMCVYLPREGQGLSACEQALDATALRAQGGTLRLVELHLPKFKFARALDLGATLTAMGLGLAFDAHEADFSKMTEAERLWIGGVLHKAFVAVDERGTEAAAATAMMALGEAAPEPQDPVLFKADRPFLFTIRHVATGAILFTGRVVNPVWEDQ